MGFLALELIIQVSDQPVAPLVGRTDFTGGPSLAANCSITFHVVPITESPDLKAAASLV